VLRDDIKTREQQQSSIGKRLWLFSGDWHQM